MDDYKFGDTVEARANMWTKTFALGVVVATDGSDFLEVRFKPEDVIPGLRYDTLLMTRSEIRKVEVGSDAV